MDPANALPMLLPVAGAVLQFVVRQFKTIPDTVFYSIAVALATGVYALVAPANACVEVRACILSYLAWMSVHFLSLLGGTAVVSNAAKGIAASNPALAKGNTWVPVTDSK